jgi:ABC-type methionine transport system permease subunit
MFLYLIVMSIFEYIFKGINEKVGNTLDKIVPILAAIPIVILIVAFLKSSFKDI